MPLRALTGEHVVCAAVRAHRLTFLEHIEEYPRMSRPQRCVGQRAVQGRSFAVTAMGWSLVCVSVMVYSLR